MKHIITKFSSHFKNKGKKYAVALIAVAFFAGAVTSSFLYLRGDASVSELAYIEKSLSGQGSVIPASCDSSPHFAGDCLQTCWDGSVIPSLSACPFWNGACASNHYACAAGSPANGSSNTTYWGWNCMGSPNGGASPYCTETKPLIGFSMSDFSSLVIQPGQSNSISFWSSNATDCTGAGTPGVVTGSLGTSGTVSTGAISTPGVYTQFITCSAPELVTQWGWKFFFVALNAVPGTAPNTCTAGTPVSSTPPFGSNQWSWTCKGDFGGTDAQGTAFMSGTLSASPLSCVIPVGQGSCPSTFTWSTTYPVGTSQVVGDGGGPSSNAANSGSQVLNVPYRDNAHQGNTFRLYNNGFELANQFVSTSCAAGGYDNIGAVCADPQVVSTVVTGQYYSTPGDIAFVCSGSNAYKVLRDGVLFSQGAYNGPMSVSPVLTGNYSIICMHGDYEGPAVVKLYNSPPPPAAVISLTASPRTIAKDADTTLFWTVQWPIPSCKLTAKVVCTNNQCTADQTAFETSVNSILATGNTDATDPHGVRSISSAVSNVLASHINSDWKGFGQKTLKISYTTDFSITCTNADSKATARVNVTQAQQQ